MTVIDYDDGIARDTSLLKPNVYIKKGRGQGCNTVWFNSVKDARAALSNNNKGVREKELHVAPDGRQAGICEQCACHYSPFDPLQKGKAEFACRDWKDYWTKHLVAPQGSPSFQVQGYQPEIYPRRLSNKDLR